MQKLSQRDPRWSKVTIGESGLNVGRWGCVLTSLSMLSTDWGPYKSPATLAKKLSFTPEARLYWQSVDQIMGFNFVHRGYGAPPKITSFPFLLEVDFSHWVLAVGWHIKAQRLYKIYDPWFGDEAVSNRYGKQTGYATFSKLKGSELPEPTWIGKLIKKLKVPFPFWLNGKKKK